MEAYAKVGSLGCLICPHSVGIGLESQGRLSYSRSSAGTRESDPCHPGIPATVRHDNMWMIRLLFTAGFVAYVVRGRDCLRRYKVQCNQVLPGHPAPAFTNLK